MTEPRTRTAIEVADHASSIVEEAEKIHSSGAYTTKAATVGQYHTALRLLERLAAQVEDLAAVVAAGQLDASPGWPEPRKVPVFPSESEALEAGERSGRAFSVRPASRFGWELLLAPDDDIVLPCRVFPNDAVSATRASDGGTLVRVHHDDILTHSALLSKADARRLGELLIRWSS